jgi:hypothetical protein
MTRKKQLQLQEIEINPSGNGRVRSFSGAGINAQYESQKEADDHQDWLDSRNATKKNPLQIKTFRVAVNDMR